MNIPFFISRRIAFNKRKTFSKLIIRIAIVAIALSMTVMIIATAMVKGFQNEISEKVYGFWGHIQVSNFDRNFSYENSPIDKNQDFYPWIDTIEGIRHIQQFATKPGIIEVEDRIDGIILKGIAEDFDWTFLEKHIVEGHKLEFPEDTVSFDIIISQTTAERLKLKVNDPIIINFVNPETFRIRARKLNITGIYNTGLEEYDKLIALVDIRQIQKLNNWDSTQIGGFEIFVDDLDRLEELDNKVYMAIGQNLNSVTIKQMKPNIFDWLELQTINEQVILVLMIIVAIINMITALLILILERTNMIGILKSLGANNWLIREIFLFNALYIIITGLIWGNFIGLGLAYLQERFGIITLSEKTYYVSVAPVSIEWFTIVLLNLGTLFITLLALLIPSYLISRISPIKAIRFK